MNTRLAILSGDFLFSLTVVVPTAAQAELANCAAREDVFDRFSDDYGEVFQDSGLQGANEMFEIWFAAAGT